MGTEPLTGFTADWVVPPPCQKRWPSCVLLAWFQSRTTKMGLPVLQPVLQYGQHGGSWEYQSWFVDGNDGRYPVVTAPAIKVSPGDKLTSYMSLSEDGSVWTVYGKDLTTGQESNLKIKYSKAGNT